MLVFMLRFSFLFVLMAVFNFSMIKEKSGVLDVYFIFGSLEFVFIYRVDVEFGHEIIQI